MEREPFENLDLRSFFKVLSRKNIKSIYLREWQKPYLHRVTILPGIQVFPYSITRDL
jgi:hypothetical protein